MGLFRSKRGKSSTSVEAEGHRSEGDAPATTTLAFRDALAEAGQLDMAEFPDATAQEAETMQQMWIGIVSKVGGAGTFDPSQVAALSTLAERLVSGNPALGGFVDRLRDIAKAESARRPSDPAWSALTRHL